MFDWIEDLIGGFFRLLWKFTFGWIFDLIGDILSSGTDDAFVGTDKPLEGPKTEARIIRIERYLGEHSDQIEVDVEWQAPESGSDTVRFSGYGVPLTVRLGSTIPVQLTNKGPVYDREAVEQHHGSAMGFNSDQRLSVSTIRGPGRGKPLPVTRPEAGIVELAADTYIKKAWKNWTPARATVTGYTQSTSMFGVGQNFDLQLRLADGTTASDNKTAVPFYGAWFVEIGTEVPVVVNPSNSAEARVVWPALATEHPGGTWRDRPPAGGLADIAMRPLPATPAADAHDL